MILTPGGRRKVFFVYRGQRLLTPMFFHPSVIRSRFPFPPYFEDEPRYRGYGSGYEKNFLDHWRSLPPKKEAPPASDFAGNGGILPNELWGAIKGARGVRPEGRGILSNELRGAAGGDPPIFSYCVGKKGSPIRLAEKFTKSSRE